MPAPSVDVTIAATATADGSLTSTNTVLMAYAAGSGPTNPITVRSANEAAALNVTQATLQHVDDLVSRGVPQVVLTRVPSTAAAATIDADGWGEAFGKLDAINYPLGQVMIPGVGTAEAHEALVTHSQDTRRCAFMDAPIDASAAAILDLAEAQAGSPDTWLTGLFADWAVVRSAGSSTRTIPGSVAAAGPTARMDVVKGHANAMPAGEQDTGTAGLVIGGLGVAQPRTTAELDAFADAGINPMRQLPGGVFLYDFLSITDDPLWTNLSSGAGITSPRSQLNYGRLGMQIVGDSGSGLRQFLFQTNDPQRQLMTRAEKFLGAYLAKLWDLGAIYGPTADDSYTANVLSVTDVADIAAGRLRAAITFAPSPAVRFVTLATSVTRAGS